MTKSSAQIRKQMNSIQNRKTSLFIKKQVTKQLKRNIETKRITTPYGGTAITDVTRTPINLLMQNIAQGDTNETRNGNQLFLTGLYFKLYFVGADAHNVIRFVLYRAKDPDDDLKTDGITVNTPIDLDKYQIYTDKRVITESVGPNVRQLMYKHSFRGMGLNTRYDGTAGGAVIHNAVKLYIVSDSGASFDPAMYGEFRIYFKDP